ncbi:uncharacterized protein BDV14DRAFT_203988 [Aspergillus stella-maris]|uniref:uncharacterized protein n=1 Tax=Aspergillus stella-maris TaxID=1810926 RepID=UPI003CCD02F2
MQFKNALLASCLALGAAATGTNSSSIVPTLLNRFAQLDIGYQETVYRLNHLASKTGSTTADVSSNLDDPSKSSCHRPNAKVYFSPLQDVVSTFNKTVNAEDKDLHSSQPSNALAEPIQLVLCQSAHNVHVNSIAALNAFVDKAAEFDANQRNTLQDALTRFNDDTTRFLYNVAQPALPICVSTIMTDDSAIYKAVNAAVLALDPSEA